MPSSANAQSAVSNFGYRVDRITMIYNGYTTYYKILVNPGPFSLKLIQKRRGDLIHLGVVIIGAA